MEKDFNENLNSVKEHIKTLMTKEGITDDELDDLTELNRQVETLGTQHQELADKHSKMKDKYIDAITNYGTGKKPDNDDGSSSGRTMEEIARDIIKKSSK